MINAIKFMIIIFAIAWVLSFLTGCASWKQVSCYQKDGLPTYQGEVRQIERNKFIEHDGELKTVKGICVHDHPGFWNRMTLGIFDSMERGQ